MLTIFKLAVMFKFDLSKIIGTNSLRSSIKQVESIQICPIFHYIVDEENCMLALIGCKHGYDEFYLFIYVYGYFTCELRP